MAFFKSIGKVLGGAVPVIGPAISAVTSLIGGRRATKKQEASAEQNLAFQRDLAQHGIRMRVADAKAAGLHPLIGAGVQPHVAPSVYAGDVGDSGVSAFGQNISRALNAVKSPNERQMEKIKLEIAKQELERAGIANDILKTERDQLKAGKGMQVGDTGVVAGQPDSSPAGVDYKRKEVTPARAPGMEVGADPGETQYVIPTHDGPAALPGPGQQSSEAMETFTTQLQYGVIKGLDIAAAATHFTIPWTRTAKVSRNKLRTYRDRYLEKPERGHFWAYDAPLGVWRQVPLREGRRLYFQKWHGAKYGYESTYGGGAVRAPIPKHRRSE